MHVRDDGAATKLHASLHVRRCWLGPPSEATQSELGPVAPEMTVTALVASYSVKEVISSGFYVEEP